MQECISRTEHIKERSLQNRKLFRQEMQELCRLLDHEDALREFMLAKQKPRGEEKTAKQRAKVSRRDCRISGWNDSTAK